MSWLSKRLLPVMALLTLLLTSAQASETPQMSISVSNGTLSGGVYQITYMASNDSVSFSWTDVGESYQVSIDPGSSFTQTENRISLTAAGYLHETYTLTVIAMSAATVIDSASIRFQLTQMDTTPQEEGIASSSMGRMARGGRGGFGQGVTPGKALTSGHEEGNRDDSLYNTVAILPETTAMACLTLDGTELDITLDDGKSPFNAEAEVEILRLIPVEAGERWHISLSALKQLNRSGITQLNLMLNEQSLTLATDWEPVGRVYAQLKAQGLASKHFILLMDANGMNLSVDGTMYRIADDDQLMLEP